jgi:hypothetical protein
MIGRTRGSRADDGGAGEETRRAVFAWIWVALAVAAYLWQYRDMAGLIFGALGFGA